MGGDMRWMSRDIHGMGGGHAVDVPWTFTAWFRDGSRTTGPFVPRMFDGYPNFGDIRGMGTVEVPISLELVKFCAEDLSGGDCFLAFM